MKKWVIVNCEGKMVGKYPSKTSAEKEKKRLKEEYGMWGLRILEVKEDGKW